MDGRWQTPERSPVKARADPPAVARRPSASSWRLESWSLRSTEETCASTVFGRDREAQRDLLVHVAAGDVLEHLALARRELRRARARRLGRGRAGERVEHEAGQPRREDRVAVVHAAHRVGELLAARWSSSRSRARPRGSTAITSSAASDTDSARKRGRGSRVGRAADHLDAAAVGHVHVEQDHVRAARRAIAATASSTVPASPTISSSGSSSARTPGAEELVVVDDQHARVAHRPSPARARPRCPRRASS